MSLYEQIKNYTNSILNEMKDNLNLNIKNPEIEIVDSNHYFGVEDPFLYSNGRLRVSKKFVEFIKTPILIQNKNLTLEEYKRLLTFPYHNGNETAEPIFYLSRAFVLNYLDKLVEPFSTELKLEPEDKAKVDFVSLGLSWLYNRDLGSSEGFIYYLERFKDNYLGKKLCKSIVDNFIGTLRAIINLSEEIIKPIEENPEAFYSLFSKDKDLKSPVEFFYKNLEERLIKYSKNVEKKYLNEYYSFLSVVQSFLKKYNFNYESLSDFLRDFGEEKSFKIYSSDKGTTINFCLHI